MILGADLHVDTWSSLLAAVPDVVTAPTLVADFLTAGGVTVAAGFLLHCSHHAWFAWGTRRAARSSENLTVGLMADVQFRRALEKANQRLWDWKLPGIPFLLSCTVDPSGVVFRNMRGDVLVRLPTAALRLLEPGELSVRLAVTTGANASSEVILTFQPRTFHLLHSSPQSPRALEDTVRELKRLLNGRAPRAC